MWLFGDDNCIEYNKEQNNQPTNQPTDQPTLYNYCSTLSWLLPAPRVVSELLIFLASSSRSPFAPVLETFSEPARSTRNKTPVVFDDDDYDNDYIDDIMLMMLKMFILIMMMKMMMATMMIIRWWRWWCWWWWL